MSSPRWATAGKGKHVVFNAHMDTMQAGDESAWSVPTLSLTRKDGRLYGLGMGNLKGGLAAMAMATAIMARHRDALPGKLSFTAVSDEVMFGNRGTEFLLHARPDLLGDVMISAEGPGFMDFAIAEKGLLWVDVETSGPSGHSSRALRGQTAVGRLAELIRRVDAFNERFAVLPPDLDGVSGGEGNFGLRLSASAGVIEAGSVRSLMSPKAMARFDMRLPPGITMARLPRRPGGYGQRYTRYPFVVSEGLGRKLGAAAKQSDTDLRRCGDNCAGSRAALRRASAGK